MNAAERQNGAIDPLRERLLERFGDRVRFGEPMSRHTSFRIGGPADVYVEVTSTDELAALVREAAAAQQAIFLLGSGTNILVSDRGIRGIVARLGKAFQFVDWKIDGDDAFVRAGAAVPFKKLVYDAVDRGFAGLEFGEGIPGSLGGGLTMNAGAFGGEIGRVVEILEGIDAKGQAVELSHAELPFSYRRLELPPAFLITGVRLRLRRGVASEMQERVRNARERRRRTQPLGFPNAGSVFKNPAGTFAGRLLEEAGVKGLGIGGARVSEQHANFIVNRGDATAADVRAVMEEMERRVLARTGVRLEPEVKLVGDW